MSGEATRFPEWETACCLVLREVFAERRRQTKKWGPQPLPDGCNLPGDEVMEVAAKAICESAMAEGRNTHRITFQEEWAEVCNAKTPADRRKELLQGAALLVKWIEQIDERERAAGLPSGSDAQQSEGEQRQGAAPPVIQGSPSFCCLDEGEETGQRQRGER